MTPGEVLQERLAAAAERASDGIEQVGAAIERAAVALERLAVLLDTAEPPLLTACDHPASEREDTGSTMGHARWCCKVCGYEVSE